MVNSISVHRGLQMLDICLLDLLDKFKEKRKKLGVDLREEHIQNLISRVNVISHRTFIEFQKLHEQRKIFVPEKDSFIDFGVVDQIEIDGDPIDWLEKIVPYLVELGLIYKTKCYVSPEETTVLLPKLPDMRGKIGEGEEQEVNEERYGVRVKTREGKWSGFWDALEYCVRISSRFNLFIYIPLLETFFEKS